LDVPRRAQTSGLLGLGLNGLCRGMSRLEIIPL